MISFFHFSKEWSTGGMKSTGENRIIRGQKAASVPLCPPQIPHGPTRNRTRVFADEKPATNRLSHGTAGNNVTKNTNYIAHYELCRLRVLQVTDSVSRPCVVAPERLGPKVSWRKIGRVSYTFEASFWGWLTTKKTFLYIRKSACYKIFLTRRQKPEMYPLTVICRCIVSLFW